MARKKVKLAFIENNSQRKATFNKRKKGLIKKVTELTTLCDVKACAIIYSPYDEAPEVWPSDEEARKLALEFKALPEIEQQRKKVDQEAYLRQRITKNDDQMKKLKKESKDLVMTELLSQSFKGNLMLNNMNILDMNDFGYKIDQYFENVMRNIKIQHESGMKMGQSSNAVAAASEGIASTTVMASTIAPTAPVVPSHEVGGSSSSSVAFYRPSQQQPQFQYPLLAPSYEVGGSSSSSSSAAFYRPSQQQAQYQYPPLAPRYEVGGSSSSSAAFYRPSQQQPQFQYPPLAPHFGQPQNLNQILNHNQNQNQRLMEMIMNHHEQLSNAAEQPQPHQPTTGDSTVSAAPGPSSDVPVTNPNPTNNI